MREADASNENKEQTQKIVVDLAYELELNTHNQNSKKQQCAESEWKCLFSKC